MKTELKAEPPLQDSIEGLDQAEAAMAIVRVLSTSIATLEQRMKRQRERLEGWARKQPAPVVVDLRHGWVGVTSAGEFFCRVRPTEGELASLKSTRGEST